MVRIAEAFNSLKGNTLVKLRCRAVFRINVLKAFSHHGFISPAIGHLTGTLCRQLSRLQRGHLRRLICRYLPHLIFLCHDTAHLSTPFALHPAGRQNIIERSGNAFLFADDEIIWAVPVDGRIKQLRGADHKPVCVIRFPSAESYSAQFTLTLRSYSDSWLLPLLSIYYVRR